jgi:hypothetical protein
MDIDSLFSETHMCSANSKLHAAHCIKVFVLGGVLPENTIFKTVQSDYSPQF